VPAIPSLARAAALAVVAATLLPGPAGADEIGQRLLGCQRRIARAAQALVAQRSRALASCVEGPAGCVGSPGPGCTASSAGRCEEWLAGLWRAQRKLEQAISGCRGPALGGRGVDPPRLFADDGLALSQVAAFCPHLALRAENLEDAARCQRHALTCTADTVVATAVPRAGLLLTGLGVALRREDAACLAATLCGNRALDGDEECDDGAANSDTRPDACRSDCRAARCGDGVVDADDECDDGATRSGDGCAADCTIEDGVCGNGVVDAEEDCDDGNRTGGDGCGGDCTVEEGVCGNGRLEAGEECDEGRLNSDVLPDRCRRDCSVPSCGDLVVDTQRGEACEPPDTLLCNDGCGWRLLPPLSPSSRPADAAAPGYLARCQDAFLRDGMRLFALTRRLVASCVMGVARCVLPAAHEDPADGCLRAATRRCAAAAEARDRARTRLRARLAAGCAGGPLVALLDETSGLGFTAIAAGCPFRGASEPTATDLFDCVLARTGCLGEGAVVPAVPRANELLGELALDADAAFPCVIDPAELE
jgi:cysteine-rich repeat protein